MIPILIGILRGHFSDTPRTMFPPLSLGTEDVIYTKLKALITQYYQDPKTEYEKFAHALNEQLDRTTPGKLPAAMQSTRVGMEISGEGTSSASNAQ